MDTAPGNMDTVTGPSPLKFPNQILFYIFAGTALANHCCKILNQDKGFMAG